MIESKKAGARCRESIDALTPPGFCFDEKPAKKSLAYLHALREEPCCGAILLSHGRWETRREILLSSCKRAARLL